MSIWSAPGSTRVFRGGCWFYALLYARVNFLYNDTPDHRSNDLGVRLVRRCT